ncbi:MAG: nucleotidyltransferase domain-containing protein [Leptospiraceae bacterium]|nr:nucleotidyltransferase domain-containing protein [Leptospiraceae bacterium]
MIDVISYIETLTNAIVENVKPEKVILFGSHAYGTPNKNSDIDILVIVKDSPLPRNERTGELYISMRKYYSNYSIDFVVYTEAEVQSGKL